MQSNRKDKPFAIPPVRHTVEDCSPRAPSNLFSSFSTISDGPFCSYGAGSCSSLSSNSAFCCEPCYIPSVQPVMHLKEIVCKNKDAFSETFKSPFAIKTIQIPGWMAYSGKILCFHSYYQEPIPESPLETYRIHRCHIRFYLEDDSIEVVEPATFDPGYPQGRVIRRGRIPLPPPAETAYYTIDHLNVGCEVEFYGKTFYICGCDAFTRRFLNRMGYPVGANLELPQDLATEKRHELVLTQFSRKAGFDPEIQKTQKFLINKGKILRFWAYWDDRCNNDGNGMLRTFNVYYFLEDDTLAVKELLDDNSGIVPQPAFLFRSKVPKNPDRPYPLPGVKEEALRILNVIGREGERGTTTGFSYMTDRLCPGIDEEECYTDRDLAIGATLNIFGRCFILTDCDEFTKCYYREKYGVQDFAPLVLDEPVEESPPRIPPPHIGIGDEEDTLANWNKLEVSPPRKNELQHMLMDKDFINLSAIFYKPLSKVNSERQFTIRYFLVDKTIQIVEHDHHNSGYNKGNFLARARLKKANGHEGNGFQPQYFLPEDFFIGQVININHYKFQLTGADETTLSYMELHKGIFPHADICNILNKMREVLGPLQSEDVLKMFSCKDGCQLGIMDFEDFRCLILDLSECSLSEHEVITLKRAYKVLPESPGIDWETVRVVIQSALRRFHFDKILLTKVENTLTQYDPCRTELIDRESLRNALRGARLPVAKELINFLVDRYPSSDECDRINYCEIIKFLNWEDNPVGDAKPTPLACIMKHLEPKVPMEISHVNYRAFLYDVCPNIKCSLPSVCCSPTITLGTCQDISDNNNNVGATVPHAEDNNYSQDWDGFCES